MQFMVPQDVQRADRILGPLTVRGFLTALGGGALAYVAYLALDDTTWPFVAGFIVILTVAFIFLRIHDMSFGQYLVALVLYVFRPQRRLWVQHAGDISLPLDWEAAEEKVARKPTDQEAQEKAKRIGTLAQTLEAATVSEREKFSQATSLDVPAKTPSAILSSTLISTHGRQETK